MADSGQVLFHDWRRCSVTFAVTLIVIVRDCRRARTGHCAGTAKVCLTELINQTAWAFRLILTVETKTTQPGQGWGGTGRSESSVITLHPLIIHWDTHAWHAHSQHTCCWKECVSTHVSAQVWTFGSTHLWTRRLVHTELTCCSTLTFLQCLVMTSETPTRVSTKETEGIRADGEQLSNCRMVAAGTYFASLLPCFQVSHSDTIMCFSNSATISLHF